MRTAYLACYDIAEPKRWRAVHKLMLAYGNPLQLSVFLCHLSPVEYEEMKSRILPQLNRAEDAFALAALGRQDQEHVETWGVARWDHGKRVVV